MDSIIVLVIGTLLFLLECFIIRKKDIDLPGSDNVEKGVLLILQLCICMMWPITLPLFIIVFIGMIITGKYEKE